MPPSTMRAWRTHVYGDPMTALVLDEVEVPTPGPGEVLVRTQAIPLNLNDLERVTGGNMAVQVELPYSPGMETMGIVDQCGPGAEAHLGRRVAAITRMAYGGFAEYVICPATSLFDVPEQIALPDAAAILFPFHLAWLGLVDRAELRAGETVLIHAAAGGSGSAAIQLAKHLGARVIATCGSEAKRQLCLDLGADVAVDYTTDDFAAVVMAETGQRGVDVVFDNVGAAVMEASMKCTAYNGRYLMMGFASDKTVADQPLVVPRQVAMGNFKLCGVLLAYPADALVPLIKGAMGSNFAPASHGLLIHSQVMELITTGVLKPVVGATFDFESIPSALVSLASRATTGRVIALLPG